MINCPSTILNDGTLIGPGESPYFVAEVNPSHFGDLDTAKQMIDSLKVMGCDCVKFQSWSEASLYSETYYEQNPIARRFVKKYQL